MCFGNHRSHLCVICLLLYSLHPASGSVIKHLDHEHPDDGSPHLDHTDNAHIQNLNTDGNLQELKQKAELGKYNRVSVDYFLDALMKKYGDGERMSFEGFEHLLEKLNLASIIFVDHSLDCHRTNSSSEFISFHSDHNHTEQAAGSPTIPCPKDNMTHNDEDNEHDDHDDHSGHDHDNPAHNHDDHSGHDHDDHSAHNHDDHSGHDHDDSAHNHDDHSGHDHDDPAHNHDDHSGHDHDDPAHNHDDHDDPAHDHDDHSGHDHDDPTHNHDDPAHNHDDHSAHNHDDQSGHDHDDPAHNHDDHSGHDHDDSAHNHDDHSGHDHDDPAHNHDDHSGHDHDDPAHNHDDHQGHDHDDPAHNHDDHSGHDHDDPAHNHDDHSDHSHDENTTPPEKPLRKRRSPSGKKEKCMPSSMMLNLVNTDNTKGLTREMFLKLCPTLIFQIESDSCRFKHEDHDHLHGDDHDHDHDHGEASMVTDTSVAGKVWGYSTIAVIIISLVGLLGVAVIPIVQKVFYNHLLQFLVALAVGALSGDALLHLLPHAIAGGHDHGHSNHDSHGDESGGHDLGPIYKGLCGLMGIYFFFFTERAVTIFTDMKRRKKKKKNRSRYSPADEEVDKVGEKLANNDMECDEMMMSIHPNKALKGYADEAHTELCTISFANSTSISHQHGHRHHHSSDKVYVEEEATIISQSSNGHGHGHGHSHCKDGVPNSISAIAWMVILGDGIHNFCDGLAIGAAFANSITGGFSTSIAVFCHELPHEIGDFAMLLRAGMSPKKAVIYNCVSSILCFFGMLIGIALGNIQSASLWVFAIVAGMFLYIALVDMLPELSSVETKKGENPFFHLFLQLLGMLIGAGIMFVIALYEDNLRSMFD